MAATAGQVIVLAGVGEIYQTGSCAISCAVNIFAYGSLLVEADRRTPLTSAKFRYITNAGQRIAQG